MSAIPARLVIPDAARPVLDIPESAQRLSGTVREVHAANGPGLPLRVVRDDGDLPCSP